MPPLPLSGRLLLGGLFAWSIVGHMASGQTVAPAVHANLSTRVRLAQANAAAESGNYDLAEKRFRAVLDADPGNELARQGLERVGTLKAAPKAAAIPAPTPDTKAIEQKLQGISIPFLEVYDKSLEEVVELIRQDARTYDTDPDESARGLNVFVKLPSGTPHAANTSKAGIPGLPAAAPEAIPPAKARITLVLSHVSVWEALQKTAAAANMKLKIEPYAVSIVPMTEACDPMVTLEVGVPPSYLGTAPEQTQSITSDVAGGNGLDGRVDAKAFLESNGVTFPAGSSATYLRRTSKMVVRNTQANIDLVQALLTAESTPELQPTPTP